MIICYKGEDLKVQDTCSTYDNISVVLFKGQKRVYNHRTNEIVGGDERLPEAKAIRN
ncbi:hypothetical protein JFD94_15540, partial [Enterococcus faecalis]|nr:hypothetical protein [Enterococcus faecalis]